METDRFEANDLIEILAELPGEGEVSLLLHRDQAGQIRAWKNLCPHAGRRLDWAPGEFLRGDQGQLICAVHGATFELAGGRCTGGPCKGERLQPVAVAVVEGRVVLTG